MPLCESYRQQYDRERFLIGRLGHAEDVGHSPPRREGDLLPVLRAPGLHRDRDGAHIGGQARPYRNADHAIDRRLRGERPSEALMTDIGLTGGANGAT
jgi:hypothetical protein